MPPLYATHGGPIAIGITGNLIGGENYSNGLAGTQAGTISNAGATFSLTRHTPGTSTMLMIPAAIGQHGSSVGQANAEYDTAHQSFLFGPQQVGALGMIPAGTTARGPAVLFPRKHGDLTLYAGVVGGQPEFVVEGARLRTIGKRGVSTVAVYNATSKGGGRVTGALFGLVTQPTRISGQIEIGVERTTNLGLNPDGTIIPNGMGFATEGRIDDGGARQYASFTFRDLSPNYESLGGLAQADRFTGLSYHASLGKAPYTVTLENETTGNPGSTSNTKSESLSLNERLGKSGSAIFAVSNSNQTAPGSVDWTGNASFGFALPLKGFALGFSGGFNRSTQLNSSPNAGSNFQLTLGRSLGQYTLQTGLALARTFSSAAGNQSSPTLTVGVARAIGKTSYTLSTQLARTFTDTSALESVSPTLSVTRRLSNVFVVTTNAAWQFRKDPLQPEIDGRSLQFSFSLGAPFAIGNGVVSGRANPKLPGTISGVVQEDFSGGFLGASAPGSTIGAPNISVVLDGGRVVRTDVQGHFTFNFLPAGAHSISIDPASLPRGTQPANPITTVNLLGGQVAQVVLGIGAYGSIIGTVQAGDAAGTPINGVAVLLDDKTRIVTDARGMFAFGGLSAGTHTVAVLPETFPANFGLAGAAKQNISIISGESSRISFVGAALGSIAGFITYATGQDAAGKGVTNAYVVANPGDHAAITEDDGSYLIDNLPPGDYTLTVDPETLGEGLAVTSDASLQAHLGSGTHVDGMNFRIGEGEKGVVFTFSSTESIAVTARALIKRLPAGASTSVLVQTSQPVGKVTATIFGLSTNLVYRAADKTWAGSAYVPANAQTGPASIAIEAVGRSTGATDIPIVIDPKIPIATFKLNPPNPARGQYVHVQAHFLVDARAGDKILWQDGTATILPKPRTGRYFEFDFKVTTTPFRGSLQTANGQLALTLLR